MRRGRWSCRSTARYTPAVARASGTRRRSGNTAAGRPTGAVRTIGRRAAQVVRMKRYPLHTLLRLREHRTDAARQVVLQKQRAVQACRDACTRIEQEIVQLGSERAGQRARLLDAPPPGVDWSSVLAQRESHIDWLGGQIEGRVGRRAVQGREGRSG